MKHEVLIECGAQWLALLLRIREVLETSCLN
jgi:hypothetical protein